jgi:hypothetical protein
MIVQLIGGPHDGLNVLVNDNLIFLTINHVDAYQIMPCNTCANSGLGHYIRPEAIVEGDQG